MTTRVIIVEDKQEDLAEISGLLLKFDDFDPDYVRHAGTFDSARDLIEGTASDTDLVLLDLSIPRNESDIYPVKDHGLGLLDVIRDLNKQRHNRIYIQVIIVSAEAFSDQHTRDVYMETYEGTLVGLANKDSLPAMLKANLKRFRRDPVRNRIAKLNVGILDEYDGLKDTHNSPLDRIEKARTIAIRLVRNEMDFFEDRLGASEQFPGDLSNLAGELKRRFRNHPTTGRPEIKANLITTNGGWGRFLWRGWHVDHLYTLNNYRRHFKHEEDQPYGGVDSSPNAWGPPSEVISSLKEGKRLVPIVEMIVQELLDWYLPWHEQVYLPWREAKTAGGSTS